MSLSNGSSDPQVVRSEDLKNLILENFGDDPNWIYHISIVMNADYRSVYRKLFKQKHVSYSIADEWLTALDMPGQINHIQVLPNPNWSNEHYIKYMSERGCI